MKLLVWFVFLAFFAFAIADDEDAILHSTEYGQDISDVEENEEDLSELEVNQREGVDLFEGDIMMDPEELEQLKKEWNNKQ